MANPALSIAAVSSGIERGGGGGSGGPNPQQPSNLGGKPKRTLIESACAACRKRKSKCDGQRPACTRCHTLGTDCSYENHEGESRWRALRRRKDDIERDRDDLRELLTFLQTTEKGEAGKLLQRIRASGFEDLLHLIRHAREDGHTDPSHQLVRPDAMHTEQQRLPSIHSMLDAQTAPMSSQGHAEVDAQGQTQSNGRVLGPRTQRVGSISSDGSGESSSAYSGGSKPSQPPRR